MESTGRQLRAIGFLCAPTGDNLGGNFKRLHLIDQRLRPLIPLGVAR
jgi:hypothetical protein